MSVDILRELVAQLDDDDDVTAAIAALTDATAAGAAVSTLVPLEATPHLVPQPGNLVEEVEENQTFDLDRAERSGLKDPAGYLEPDPDDPDAEPVPYWVITTTATRLLDSSCPDCRRGCRSVDGVLVCLQLPARVGSMGGEAGDVVACGLPR